MGFMMVWMLCMYVARQVRHLFLEIGNGGLRGLVWVRVRSGLVGERVGGFFHSLPRCLPRCMRWRGGIF